MNILQINGSARHEGANSTRIANAITARLQAQHPEAFAIVSLAAVDGEHVRDWSTPVDDRSEVVFMSKFSGG